jgi:hypothetical protein
MKPFTFMTVVLGLILGFLFASSRPRVVPNPLQPPGQPIVVQVGYAPESRDIDNDDADADDEDRREAAEGLPVPIVPGTRVTEAEILPPKRVEARRPTRRRFDTRVIPIPPGKDVSTVRTIAGRLSATVDRARNDARLQLEREVTEWLAPEVPTRWKPPAHLISQMIRKTEDHPIVKDYGTVYETTLNADFSPEFRGEILAAFHREVVARRLAILGGSLGFILACLAALAGYIRADEATRGYYTHWLRVAAAAGVGASGVLIYQILA